MRPKVFVKSAIAGLLGKDYVGDPPVEGKNGFRSVNPVYTPLYGRSRSGEKTHIVRQSSRDQVYICGAQTPRGLRMLSTDPPDPSSLCKNCSALFQGGAR